MGDEHINHSTTQMSNNTDAGKLLPVIVSSLLIPVIEGFFFLTCRHMDTVQHFKILTDSNNKFYIWPNYVFFSINELVEKYHTENVSGDHMKIIQLRDMHQEVRDNTLRVGFVGW